MSKDLWILKRKVVRTTKLRKYVEIPAFSYNCWYPKQSLKMIDGSVAPNICYTTFNDTFYKDAFTVEFWAYMDYAVESNNPVLVHLYNLTNTYLKVYLALDYIGIQVRKATVIQSFTVPYLVPTGQWFHIAATYDGTKLRLYFNGLLIGTSGDIASPLDNNSFTFLTLLSDSAGSNRLYGYIDEVRIFDSALSGSDIEFFYNKHYYPAASGLKLYFNMDDATDDGATVTIPNDGSLFVYITATSDLAVELNTTKTAPIILGASFVVAEFVTAFGGDSSIKYPIKRPNDASNFGLYVSWVDANGDFQRRKLFDPDPDDGVIKIAPPPADYAGERMPDGFKFEIINVDGEDYVTLGSTLTIEISLTTNPANGTDHAQSLAQALAADTTLAENFPYGNGTLNFDTQQTY